MYFLHHRQKTRDQVLEMPQGLQELMCDISREVLRCQPSMDCIYKFVADYLENRVNTRDKSKVAMEIIEEAILKTDEVYSQFAKCKFPKYKTDSFVNVMGEAFRRFIDHKRRKNEDPRFIKFHADDMLEELVRKCDLTKVEILRSKPAIQWAYRKFVKTYLAAIEGTLDTEDLYLNTEELLVSSKEHDQMHESAVKIQKVFRGYQTRKSLQKSKELPSKLTHRLSQDSSSTISSHKKNVLENGRKLSQRSEEHDLSLSIESSISISKPHKNSSKESEILPTSITEEPEVSFSEGGSRKSKEPLITSQESSNQNLDENLESSNTDLSDRDLNEAAVKIQATFKGYRVRKEMTERNLKTFQEQHSNDAAHLESPSSPYNSQE